MKGSLNLEIGDNDILFSCLFVINSKQKISQ